MYGSYIEDSFVGELVGDYVNQENDKDVDDLANNWGLNNGNNEIEFEFDSFGPESIIYTGNGDTLEDKNSEKPALVVGQEIPERSEDINGRHLFNVESSTCFSQKKNESFDELVFRKLFSF